MCDTIVDLMVTQGNNIRSKHIHDLDGGDALVFTVDQRTTEHITGYSINDIGFFMTDFINITGQHGNTTQKLLIHLFCKEIAVQVIGVNDRYFFRFFIKFPLSAIYSRISVMRPSSV